MNVLVETNKEYTSQMINIVAPYIHEGIQSIYREAVKVSKPGEELKSFQVCLKQIVTWPKTIIESEKERIYNESNCASLLEDLLKAIIKSYILILTNTPPEKKHELKIQFTLEFNNFLHQIYIESAKAFYQNPFIYFHNNPPIEITRNQREALHIIKECIREAIRKMLPLNLILRAYLGDAYSESSVAKAEQNIADIEKAVTEQDKTRVTALLEIDKNKYKDDENVHYQLKTDNRPVPSDFQIIKTNKESNRENKASKNSQNNDTVKKTGIADLYKDGKTINLTGGMRGTIHPINPPELHDDQRGVLILPDSTGKIMEMYKTTMPAQYGLKKNNDVHITMNRHQSLPSNTSESYMPKDKNIAIFETYSNGKINEFKEQAKEFDIDTGKKKNAANNEANF